MEWPKVKNIIILILVLVNIFLLALVGGQQRQIRRYEQSSLLQAAKVLEQNGIAIEEDTVLQAASSLSPMTSSRDLDREAAIAQGLLGHDVVCTDRRGGLYIYSNPAGSAAFRSSGDVDFTLTNCPLNGSRPADHAADLLKAMGLEGELAETSDDGSTLIFRQLWDGVPLYSCRLTFSYDGGRLRSISGSLLACSSLLPAEDGSGAMPLSTALVRFMKGILDSGDVCSAITGLRPGYRTTQTFGSSASLTPVWLVSTNVSEYYLNAVTGEVSRAL